MAEASTTMHLGGSIPAGLRKLEKLSWPVARQQSSVWTSAPMHCRNWGHPDTIGEPGKAHTPVPLDSNALRGAIPNAIVDGPLPGSFIPAY